MFKVILFLTMFTMNFMTSFAQVGIGTNTPDASAVLDITSNSKGVLFPRLTTAQRNNIPNPVAGLTVYDSDLNNLFVFNGSIWVVFGNAPVYQDIRGKVTIVSESTYTIDPTDHIIVTKFNNSVVITLPALTSGDAGRMLYINNSNSTASATTVTALPTSLPFGNSINQSRGRFYFWDGSAWLAITL